MEKSWLGLFEALVLGPLFLRQHRPQLAHAMPAQEAAVESGAGYLGTEILPRQRQQIIEGNFQQLTQFDDDHLLRWIQCCLQAVGRMGAIARK